MSAAASSWSTSWRVPSSSTVSPRSWFAISCSSACRSGPSPAISSRAVPGSRAAIACTRVVKSFGGRNRPTLSRVTGVRGGPGARCGRSSSTPLWIMTVRSGRQVRARIPASHLAVRDADRGRGERAHGAVGVEVEARGEPLVGLEGPAVDGEEPDGDAGGDGRQPPEDAGLRAVGVDDGRALAADQPVELDEPEQVAQRVQRAADVAERQVPHARAAAGVAEEPVAVRGDQHVVLPGQRGKERSHVLLRPAGLRERDQQQNARARHGRRRIYLPRGTMRIRRSATESIRHLTVYVDEA